MTKIKLFVVLMGFFSFVNFYSCSSDDVDKELDKEVHWKISANSVLFDLGGGSKKLEITSTHEWNATVSPETDLEWCSLVQKDDSLFIETTINRDTTERTTTIYIQSGEGSNKKTQNISVYQNAGEVTYIQSSDNNIEVTEEGGTRSCEVFSNNILSFDWAEESKEQDWVTCSINDNILTFTFQPNSGDDARSATYIITSSGGKNKTVHDTLTLNQYGAAPSIGINLKDYNTDYDNTETFTLKVTSNIQYKVWQSSQVNFVQLDSIAKGTYTIRFKEPNYSTSEKTTVIYIDPLDETLGESVGKVLNITQSAAPIANLSVTENALIISDGLTKYLGITCSMKKWDSMVTDENGNAVSWLTVSSDYSLKEVKLSCKDVPSTTRKAFVTFSCGGGANQASQKIEVTQTSNAPFLFLEKKSINIPADGSPIKISVITNQSSWNVEKPEWVKAEISADQKYLILSADVIEGGSRTETITIKSGDLTASIMVEQSRPYQLGDIFMLNGKKLGIVYEISEDGLHGKAFSFKGYSKMDLHWSSRLDDYQDPAIATSATNGQDNMAKIKAVANWESIYPMAAWVDKQNDADGNPGWYFPAINEVKDLVMFINGDKDEKGNPIFTAWNVSETAKARRASINEIISNNGGEKFFFSWDDIEAEDEVAYEQAYYLYSSTEGNPGEDQCQTAHAVYLYIAFNYIEYNGNRSGDLAAGSVRPILKF